MPGEVNYSLFAMKVTLRGTTSGMKIESLKERWLEATMTGPTFGTLRNPVTLGLKRTIKIGVRKDLRNVYATVPAPFLKSPLTVC
jgi:hypothetical protein